MQATRKLKVLLTTAVCIAIAIAAAGCGSSAKTTANDTTTKQKTTYAAIGKKSSGKYVYQINLTNKTGKKITGFAIKDSANNQYSANMLTEKKPFKVNQTRTLYYDAKNAIKKATGDSDKEINPEYTIQLTYEDKSTSELHKVPVDDIKNASIKFDGDKSVAYLSYKSKGTKETISTQSNEVKIKEDADKAAAEKAAQEKAAAEQAAAQQQATTQQQTTTQRQTTTNTVSSNTSTGTTTRRSTTTYRSTPRTTTRSYSSSSSSRSSTPRRSSAPRRSTTTRSTSRPATSSRSSGSSGGTASGTSGGGCVGNGAMY